eukprot:scaffold6691_cov358-Prasinococcus_capsulatus_cf.AAC.2
MCVTVLPPICVGPGRYPVEGVLRHLPLRAARELAQAHTESRERWPLLTGVAAARRPLGPPLGAGDALPRRLQHHLARVRRAPRRRPARGAAGSRPAQP